MTLEPTPPLICSWCGKQTPEHHENRTCFTCSERDLQVEIERSHAEDYDD